MKPVWSEERFLPLKQNDVKEREVDGILLTINKYVKANSLEEAYEMNQARNARIIGGMMWMRQGNAKVQTIIDLSGLELDQIEETEHVFRIGAMCTLRALEMHEGLRSMFGDGIAESVRHIVGVQFRNQATVGGSIVGRFGFSDVLTCLLALDTFVELYHGGTIRLSEYVKRKRDKDILISVIVRKSKRKLCYEAIRQSKTDFPVLTSAVVTGQVNGKEAWYITVGARPMKAELIEKEWPISTIVDQEQLKAYASEAANCFSYGTNMRGSASYRKKVAEVLILRAMQRILAEVQNR